MFVDVSPSECIDALVLAGFRVTRRAPEGAVLERGAASVLVPNGAILSPDALDAVLVSASIPHQRFAELLKEMPTQPDLGAPVTFQLRRA